MTKIKIIGALVFTSSILVTVLFNYANEQSKISNALLNTINQQKAFTQEISKNIFYIYKNKNASLIQLDNSLKGFILNMNSKDKKINQMNSIAIKEQSVKILSLWNSFYLEVQHFRDLSKITTSYSKILLEKSVNKIYNINLDLIIEFDKLIDIHQAESQKKMLIYENLEYFLFFILVSLLIYLFTQVKEVLVFIQRFLTTSKKVISNSSIKDLQPLKTEVNNTNSAIFDAANNFNFLIKKINDSIVYSSESIEHSYKSLESVESNIEDFLELVYSMDDNKEVDKELTKKEDAIIQTLEKLTSATQHLKELKMDLNSLVSDHSH